ncbi:TetR family transcriptional regulator [Mycolicibacillus parakoreensis]|uniref:TetR family transcriptional regulator n=1 Tax=Mycolicibacillus parakoreensis TaxID=1069221 RepID=A0ABY3U488_9MYCO|nr:TetR family transcriptional regulator [Mycolicibacillus parakoreensis]MCV7315271.1 TetR family transcriptional regulator [Mycolicibacillus parakoreensis]ULN53400.1 TetR family transcriptional regulator [Mycolicibacillus parakoreensis]
MSEIGLRERKKFATKEALGRAALDLAVERGLDAVTAESIAEAAQVSTRTFHNYFSCKEDAVLFEVDKSVQHMVEAFVARDPDEPVLESLEEIQVAFIESADALERMIAVTRLMANHPALIAQHVANYELSSVPMLAEIARRSGTDPDTDLYPRLVYHAAGAVVTAVIELHIASGEPPSRDTLATAVRAGYARLKRGLPQPPADGGAS